MARGFAIKILLCFSVGSWYEALADTPLPTATLVLLKHDASKEKDALTESFLPWLINNQPPVQDALTDQEHAMRPAYLQETAEDVNRNEKTQSAAGSVGTEDGTESRPLIQTLLRHLKAKNLISSMHQVKLRLHNQAFMHIENFQPPWCGDGCRAQAALEFNKTKAWYVHGRINFKEKDETGQERLHAITVHDYLTLGKWRYIDHPQYAAFLLIEERS